MLWLIEKDQKKLQIFDSLGTYTGSFNLSLNRSNNYYRFYLGENHILWAIGNSIFTRFDLKSQTLHNYPITVEGREALYNLDIFDIIEDSRDRLWLVGGVGALVFNKQTCRFAKYYAVSYSHSVFEDSRHNIWIGGGDQVFLLKPDWSDFKDLGSDKRTGDGNFASVWRMAEDKKGRIWAVTRQGLQRFDSRSGKFWIDPKIQLSKIEDIQIDRSGYIWLATEGNLTRYHPDRGTLQTYGYQDGLPFNGITRPASSIQGPTGRLYFMANKGIFYFSPTQIEARNDSSRIVFTGLKLSGREVKPGDETGLLKQSLNQTSNLNLRHDQNIFSINFAMLSFPRSERNRYAYKLQGFDDKWIYSDNPTATYMNLPSGAYVLCVRASNGDGYWSTRSIKLQINILPPWWKAWYAFLFYILLFGALVYAVTRFFWLRSSFRKEKALNQVKLDFFTNVSHEIRTHLSLISGPLEKVYEQFKEGKSIESNRLRDEMKERYRKLLSQDQEPTGSIVQDLNEAFIAKLRVMVTENISEPSFGVNEIARHVGMSVSVLYRKIRSLTGMTVNDFVKTIRFNEAKKLLESGVYSVSEVASIIGYDSSRHFSNEFKKVFGQSPREIKRETSG